MEPQRQRGMEAAQRGPVDERAKGDRESRNSLMCIRKVTCCLSEISNRITGNTGEVPSHGASRSSHRTAIAYQAHLVFKALPSIIAGFLLTEEKRHLQSGLELCLSGTNHQHAEGQRAPGVRVCWGAQATQLCSNVGGVEGKTQTSLSQQLLLFNPVL